MNVSMVKKFLKLWQAKSLVLVYVLLGLSTYAAHGADQVVINNAWYGTDAEAVKPGSLTQQNQSKVIAKLKEVVAKYGFLVITSEQNKFYGFDPLPGTVKTTAIDATVNGVRKIDYRAPEGKDFVLPASLAGTPQANAALAEIKAALAPASTSASGAPITYGSTIKLSFPAIAGAGLHSHGFNYWHDASSKQQQVTGKLLGDGGDNWIVMGPFGTAATYQLGAPVANGAKIRLAYPQTNGWLHVQALDKYKSPDLKLLEVSVLNNSVLAGGNTGDDWIVTTSDGQPWTDGSSITLRPATYSTSSYLTAGATTFNVRQAAGGTDNQRVVGLGLSPAYWRASILKPAAAVVAPEPVPVVAPVPATTTTVAATAAAAPATTTTVAATAAAAPAPLLIIHAYWGTWKDYSAGGVSKTQSNNVTAKLKELAKNNGGVLNFPESTTKEDLDTLFGYKAVDGAIISIDARVYGKERGDNLKFYKKPGAKLVLPSLLINYAWFGLDLPGSAATEGNKRTASIVMAKMANSMQLDANGNNFLSFPSNLVDYFQTNAFPDTDPSKLVLAIDATVDGVRKNNYRVPNGAAQIFPPGMAVATPAQADLVINYAWFGREDAPGQVNTQTAATVVPKLRASIVTENGRGVIHFPANLVEFFGIDPLPGQQKVLAIDATINGVRKNNYRVQDGVAQIFPLAYEATLVAAAPGAMTPAATPPVETPVVATPVTADAITVPDGFEEDGGPADSVTVGSRNGSLEAWMVSSDGKLYRYNNYTIASDPWVLVDANGADGKPLAGPLRDVSVSSDGVMCVLDGNGKAFMYDWDKKIFNAMVESPENKGILFEFISAGSKNNIVAVDEDGNILSYSNSGWEVIQEGEAMQAAAGIDGTILALNREGQAYSYFGDSKWNDMPGANLARIALADESNIWGVGVNGELYNYSGDLAYAGNTAVQTTSQQPAASTSTATTVAASSDADTTANKWQTKQGGKKAARGKKAQKGAGKKAQKAAQKGQKRAGRKNAQANVAVDTTTATVAAVPVQTQNGQTASVGKWVQVQSRDGKDAIGFQEIAVNSAGTVFVTSINGTIYHKGDAGSGSTAATSGTATTGVVAAGAVAADVAPADSSTMTRRQARKAGKLDAAGGQKKQGKAQKDPSRKQKNRPEKTGGKRGKKQAVAAS